MVLRMCYARSPLKFSTSSLKSFVSSILYFSFLIFLLLFLSNISYLNCSILSKIINYKTQILTRYNFLSFINLNFYLLSCLLFCIIFLWLCLKNPLFFLCHLFLLYRLVLTFLLYRLLLTFLLYRLVLIFFHILIIWNFEKLWGFFGSLQVSLNKVEIQIDLICQLNPSIKAIDLCWDCCHDETL